MRGGTCSGHAVRASNVICKRSTGRLCGALPAFELDGERSTIDVASAETTVKYAGYLRRQQHEIERSRKDDRRRIPPQFAFERVPGLSREVVQRLQQVRPDTLGQARRIPGITPAAVAVLSAYIGRAQVQASI